MLEHKNPCTPCMICFTHISNQRVLGTKELFLGIEYSQQGCQRIIQFSGRRMKSCDVHSSCECVRVLSWQRGLLDGKSLLKAGHGLLVVSQFVVGESLTEDCPAGDTVLRTIGFLLQRQGVRKERECLLEVAGAVLDHTNEDRGIGKLDLGDLGDCPLHIQRLGMVVQCLDVSPNLLIKRPKAVQGVNNSRYMPVLPPRLQKFDVFVVEVDRSNVLSALVVRKGYSTEHARFDNIVVERIVDT